MKKAKELAGKLQMSMYSKVLEFKNSERGDTNFVSMLLIIGIVVVLAGAFLSLANGAMSTISGKVNSFIAGL